MRLSLRTPIVLLCFNRPAKTQAVMQTIRAARPHRLYVVADGGRVDVEGEAESCAAVRRIATAVDWPCEVFTDFAPQNLGCYRRVASGLSWAFGQSEELIILEDDCLAHPDFFTFCDELLERYRHDERIFAVSGDNFQKGPPRTADSYYFSRIFHCWGWASWRRSWQSVDLEMTDWPVLRDGGWLEDAFADRRMVEYFTRAFDETYHGRNSSWAYRASFSSLAQGRVNILPGVNLVRNIGLDEQATHTAESGHMERAAGGLPFPLRHPRTLIVDRRADNATFVQDDDMLLRRIRRRLKSVFSP
jgi:hypothetical protein